MPLKIWGSKLDFEEPRCLFLRSIMSIKSCLIHQCYGTALQHLKIEPRKCDVSQILIQIFCGLTA